MPLDFPNSPTLNETFTGNGTVWKWDGGVWDLVPVSSVNVVYGDGFIVSDITTGIYQTPISGASLISNIIYITQSAYEALSVRTSGTMYVIVT
jgi:hypothetical protein